MISFIQVIDVLRTFAQGHLQLQKFDFDFREQMPNLATVNEAYPMLYVVPVGSTNIQFGKEFELDIYCVDRYKKDRSNVGYVISDTELILSDLSVYLENQTAFDSSYGNTTPINNDLLDYVGGHVMRIRVTVEKQALCEIPFDGEQPTPPTCPSALIRNSDGSWTEIVASGATYVLPDTPVTVRNVSGDEVGSGDVPSVTGGVVTVPDCTASGDGTAVLKDTDGNVLSTTNVAPETTVDIIAPDADYEIRKSNNAILYQGTIPSGGALVQNIQDSAVRVRKSDNQLIAEVDVQAESIENYNVADSTAVLKDSAGTIISTTLIKATESEDILAPDVDLEINSLPVDSFPSGSTIDLQLTDGVNPVNPDSVTVVGNVVTAQVPAGGGLDPDAEAFLTAASITDATITSAIDTLVKDLKDFDIWNKCRAIYPFVGGTATTHKFNLKDPRDTNDALRLTFFGGITHSATGADPNGTTGYADPFVMASSVGINDIHLSFYSRENTHTGAGQNFDIGHASTSSNRCVLSCGLNNTTNPTSGMGNSLISSSQSADGFFVGTFNYEGVTNQNRLYRNGVQIVSGSGGKVTDSLSTLNLFRLGGLGVAYSDRECAFASIGFGLTATDVTNFNNIVQAFNTTLSRHV